MQSLIKRNILLNVLVSAGMFVSLAVAQQGSDSSAPSMSSKTSPGLTAADAKFMKKAADGGMAEVELGQLAATKASSPEVKQFGQRMVDDHSKANEQLKQLASQKNVDLPQEPSAKHKATKARLEQLSGDNFDQAYMSDMLKDHKQDVAEFQRASKTAHDPDLKSFAAQTLPTLQEHLKQAESIAPAQTQRSSTQPPNASQR
jgi:putative membrane protein